MLGALCLCLLLSPLAASAADLQPPIPIHFTLKNPGFVTLVIEDESGRRVRNLVSETEFPAGENTAYWDGLDDLGRNAEAARHGVYDAPGTLVKPGTYRVRGLTRPAIRANYVMTPYFGKANPPWNNGEHSSEWLANHTPPDAVAFVPAGRAPERKGQPTSAGGQVLIGSYVAEGGSGVAWLDTDGAKLYGQMWIGGVWTGATQIAVDSGPNAVPGVYAYTASAWDNELRLYELQKQKGNAPRDTRMGYGDDRPVLSPTWKFPNAKGGAWNQAGDIVEISGLAARNGLIVIALPKMNSLLFVDGAKRQEWGTVPLANPRGLAFDKEGRLLALSGESLVRYRLPEALKPFQGITTGANDPTIRGRSLTLPAPETVLIHLDKPQNLTLDLEGSIYISERGDSHCIRVFAPTGEPLRTIGKPGKPATGRYDPARINNPNGMAIDDKGHLWVAENDFQPKRVSVWDAKTGKLWKAFYGGPVYGGGGQVDSRDPNLFYYSGMTLALDRKTRDSKPTQIYYRKDNDPLQMDYDWGGAPQQPIYVNGKTYLTDCYNLPPTNGIPFATLWMMQANGIARPVAAFGRANDWKLLKTAAYRSRWPQGVDPNGKDWWYGDGAEKNGTFFLWTDKNGDGKIQPEEIEMKKAITGGVTVMPDLSFILAQMGSGGGQRSAVRFAPTGFGKGGVPQYDFNGGQVLATGTDWSPSTGGDQVWAGKAGWSVFSTAPQPYSTYSVAGFKDGKPQWSYPNLWPGLHASHDAPLPDHPGEIIGLTKLLGPSVTPKGEAGEMLAYNGNKGNVYLMTTDGLFVATLFQDCRKKGWDAPKATVGQDMTPYSLGEESFFPTITQTKDGAIYLQGNTSLMQLEGLENITRLPAQTLTVSANELAEAQTYFTQKEIARQQTQADSLKPLQISLRTAAPLVEEKSGDWKPDALTKIDNRASAGMAVFGDRLYAYWKTDDSDLLRNKPLALQNLFKTGGALDLMLDAIPGGERLLVTKVNGKTVAVLYQPRVPGNTAEPVKFVSNIGTLKTTVMDRVEDVSGQIELTQDGASYQISASLALLNIAPQSGKSLRGDIGILRGNGFQTLQRVYWRNKATGLVSDLATEAELTPELWGTLLFP